MATVDPSSDEIVIRIVYDGPPLAGKTTNLLALGRMLAARRCSEVFTPAESGGRTLWFDWMDYLGGWCDGRQVRCQLVTVPGQRSLGERRRKLLREADVVVFVAEATETGLREAIRSYGELKAILAGAGDVPAPVVLQANKLDLPGALPVDGFRERFEGERLVGVVGSSASLGRGVREAFAFAVRLALDRVRELERGSRLARGAPAIRTGGELLRWLEQDAEDAEPPAPEATPAVGGAVDPLAVGTAPTPRDREAIDADGTCEPAPPDSSVPSGLVWPPMAGRIVLQELESFAIHLVRHGGGAWLGSAGGRWRLLSRGAAVFADVEAGRQRLLEEARRHAELEGLLSEARALVLADTRSGTWRVWHVVRASHSLARDLESALGRKDLERSVSAVCDIAHDLVLAAERFRGIQPPLPATLRSVGGERGAPRFLGILPEPGSGSSTLERVDPPAVLLRRELEPHLAPLLRADPGALLVAFEAARRARGREERAASVIDTIASLVIGR